MHRSLPKPGLLVVLSATAVLIGVATGVASQRDVEQPKRQQGSALASPITPKPTVNDIASGHRALGVFRRARQAQDVVPADLKSRISQGGLMGENPNLARRALATDFGRTYYVAPGADDTVCLASDTGSGACAPVKMALTGEFNGTEVCSRHDPNAYVQSGMLPDEAGDRITVTFADGQTAKIAVKDNVYAFAVDRHAAKPIGISWLQDGQPVQISPYVTDDVSTAKCALKAR